MSLLFEELDRDKTCSKIDTFLADDLEKLILVNGKNLTGLCSPSLSLTPSHSGGVNHVEASIIRGLDTEAEIRAIHHTIYRLPEISKVIMRDLHICRMENWQVTEATRYGRTQYSVLGRGARLFFADSFDHWQRYTGCSLITDLYRYKEDRKDADKVMAR